MPQKTTSTWLIAMAWLGFISALSHGFVDSRSFVHGVAKSVPKLTTEASFSTFWSQWWWLFVKGWHVLEFFLLALLLHRAISTRLPRNAGILLAAGLAIGGAFLDEWHQTFIPYRGGNLSDVLIDSVGVLLAVLWIRRASKVARPIMLLNA